MKCKLSLTVLCVLAAVSVSTKLTAAEDIYEKCYGISEKGQNDGWGEDLNPGKYESNSNFDGLAWRFVDKGTCIQLGGKLEPFIGLGAPDLKERG